MNIDSTFLIIAGCVFIGITLVISLIALGLKKVHGPKNREMEIDIRCKFSERELKLIDGIREKYRCTASELILLGAWKFQDEGRNVFDLVDSRREFVNQDPNINEKKGKDVPVPRQMNFDNMVPTSEEVR